MKKLLALLLALAMLFSVASIFAGCEDSGKKKKSSSSRDDDEDEEDEEEDEEEEKDDNEDENQDEGENSEKPSLPAETESATVTVPNLVGKYEEALPIVEYKKMGLIITVGGEEYHEEYEAGRIVRQDPAADEEVPEGTTVIIYVSKGTMPTDSTYGNQEGDLCYPYDLRIADENGETGETVDPTKTGKVTLINFWGTWCGPCVNEMQALDMLAENFDICVIAVHSVDCEEAMPAFIGEHYPNSNIIFAYDGVGNGFSGEFYTMMGNVGFYPYSILLDADGYIVQIIEGAMDYNYFANAVKEAGAESVSLMPTAKNVSVQDGYFEILNTELVSDYAPKCFHVPEVWIDDTVLPNVSRQLMDELLPMEESYELQNMTYEWWQQGDILSILVRYSWVFNDAISYQVYNISISEDRIIEDFEFYNAMGVRMHDAVLSLTYYLRSYCDGLTPSEYVSQEEIDFIIQYTMSEENIYDSMPFLGADGMINFVTKIAVPAGSGWVTRLYNGNGQDYYVDIDPHDSCD